MRFTQAFIIAFLVMLVASVGAGLQWLSMPRAEITIQCANIVMTDIYSIHPLTGELRCDQSDGKRGTYHGCALLIEEYDSTKFHYVYCHKKKNKISIILREPLQ